MGLRVEESLAQVMEGAICPPCEGEGEGAQQHITTIYYNYYNNKQQQIVTKHTSDTHKHTPLTHNA